MVEQFAYTCMTGVAAILVALGIEALTGDWTISILFGYAAFMVLHLFQMMMQMLARRIEKAIRRSRKP